MRLLQGEGSQGIAEVIEVGGGDRRRRHDGHIAFPAHLSGKIARSQTHHVVRYRNLVLVIIRGSVPDTIDQVARSISAWLK